MFQFTHPVRGATGDVDPTAELEQFQFTHPVRGATLAQKWDELTHFVSIHAPRAGCDCTGFDLRCRCVFQFTHPVRGATSPSSRAFTSRTCFNSRTPCGVRPSLAIHCAASTWFQFTHPVRGATADGSSSAYSTRFQFTHPVRGATQGEAGHSPSPNVSIHAPRAGCDPRTGAHRNPQQSFNSRTPCGVRPAPDAAVATLALFQFTHPVRGATRRDSSPYSWHKVSIHAPRAGCDVFT